MPVDSEWFENIWAHREDVLFPSLFGKEMEGIYPIPMSRLEAGKVPDPRWSTCGVFRFAPTESRQSWLYVSSGLSNAWFDDTPDPSETSGFGCEFIMETHEKADWPIQRLHQIMTIQLGYCLGKYSEPSPMLAGDRIPLGSSIDFKESKLTKIVLAEPTHVKLSFEQKSGVADFIQVVGITLPEVAYARSKSSTALIEILQRHTSFPLTDPRRLCSIAP